MSEIEHHPDCGFICPAVDAALASYEKMREEKDAEIKKLKGRILVGDTGTLLAFLKDAGSETFKDEVIAELTLQRNQESDARLKYQDKLDVAQASIWELERILSNEREAAKGLLVAGEYLLPMAKYYPVPIAAEERMDMWLRAVARYESAQPKQENPEE